LQGEFRAAAHLLCPQQNSPRFREVPHCGAGAFFLGENLQYL